MEQCIQEFVFKKAHMDQVHVVVLRNGSPCGNQRCVVRHPLAGGAPGSPCSASVWRIVCGVQKVLLIIPLILSPSDELGIVVVDAIASVNGDDGPGYQRMSSADSKQFSSLIFRLPCIAEPMVPNHAGSGQEVVGAEWHCYDRSCCALYILWATNWCELV